MLYSKNQLHIQITNKVEEDKILGEKKLVLLTSLVLAKLNKM